jgi:cell division protein ZapA (FtsZ GTPase activity inhibitor)
MEDKLSIKVMIADRHYPLKVAPETEPRIRNAAKIINEKILQYKKQYKEKDDQDFLAMAALQLVSKMLELEQANDTQPFVEGLSQLDTELKEYLDNQ